MNFQEIIKKLLLEKPELIPEDINKLYEIFKDNGYLCSEEEFYEDFLKFFYDNTQLIEERNLSVSGGSNYDTKIGSGIMAGLISLGLLPAFGNNNIVSASEFRYSNNNIVNSAQQATIVSKKDQSQDLWNKLQKFLKYHINRHDALTGVGVLSVSALGLTALFKLSPSIIRLIDVGITKIKTAETPEKVLDNFSINLKDIVSQISTGGYDNGGEQIIITVATNYLKTTYDKLTQMQVIKQTVDLNIDEFDISKIPTETFGKFKDFIDLMFTSISIYANKYVTKFSAIVTENMNNIEEAYKSRKITIEKERKLEEERKARLLTDVTADFSRGLSNYLENKIEVINTGLGVLVRVGNHTETTVDRTNYLDVNLELLNEIIRICFAEKTRSAQVTISFKNCRFTIPPLINKVIDFGSANLVFENCAFEECWESTKTKGTVVCLGNCTNIYGDRVMGTLRCRTLFIPHNAVEIPRNLIQYLDATESVESPMLFYQTKCPKIICTAPGDNYLGTDYSNLYCEKISFPNLQNDKANSLASKLGLHPLNYKSEQVLVEMPNSNSDEQLREFGETTLNGIDDKFTLLMLREKNPNTGDSSQKICGIKNTENGPKSLPEETCAQLFQELNSEK